MGRAEDLFHRLEECGCSVIDEYIEARVSEELFLDFKRSSDNGEGRGLSQNDRNNFAKAISGFGNSEGGVVVWGIDCRTTPSGADVPIAKYPISDVAKFVSHLEGALSGLTVPAHSGVRSIPIAIDGSSGFVATLIPKSNRAPHQEINSKKYFIRAGSDFVPAPHSVLAGMFGQRPVPYIFHMYQVSPIRVHSELIAGTIGFEIFNDGPSIARDVFVNLMVLPPSRPSTFTVLPERDIGFTFANSLAGLHTSAVSNDGFKLPPDGRVCPMALQFSFRPPFDDGLTTILTYGCDGAPTIEVKRDITQNRLEAIFTETVELNNSDPASAHENFIREIFTGNEQNLPHRTCQVERS